MSSVDFERPEERRRRAPAHLFVPEASRVSLAQGRARSRCPELDCLRAKLPPGTLATAEQRAIALGIGADRVLIAADPDSAVTLASEHLGLIDMLLTDVILPGMSGVKLAESLAPAHPDMRVLYVSGYTADAIVHHGGQGPNFAFLSKPFSLSALARKIRSVLDERATAKNGDAVSMANPVGAKSSSN